MTVKRKRPRYLRVVQWHERRSEDDPRQPYRLRPKLFQRTSYDLMKEEGQLEGSPIDRYNWHVKYGGIEAAEKFLRLMVRCGIARLYILRSGQRVYTVIPFTLVKGRSRNALLDLVSAAMRGMWLVRGECRRQISDVHSGLAQGCPPKTRIPRNVRLFLPIPIDWERRERLIRGDGAMAGLLAEESERMITRLRRQRGFGSY